MKSDKSHWMNNKLKFLTDSQRAYSAAETKEKVGDFYALTKNIG